MKNKVSLKEFIISPQKAMIKGYRPTYLACVIFVFSFLGRRGLLPLKDQLINEVIKKTIRLSINIFILVMTLFFLVSIIFLFPIYGFINYLNGRKQFIRYQSGKIIK